MKSKQRLTWPLLLVTFLLINVTYIVVKERVFHRVIGQKIEAFFEKRYNMEVSVGNVKGNLLTSLYLENVEAARISGLPEGVKIIIREARFRYNLLELIRRAPGLELEGLELSYKTIRVPVKFKKIDNSIALHIDETVFGFSQIGAIFPFADKKLHFDGSVALKAEAVFENFRPKDFDLELVSDDLKVFYGDALKAEAVLKLNLKNKNGMPNLKGVVRINEAEYYGGLNHADIKNFSLADFGSSISMDVALKGNYIKIKNEALDVNARANLKLMKDARKPPYLLGRIEALSGTYTVFQNTFKLSRAEVFFVGPEGKEVRVDICAQTKVRRYLISAAIKGTPASSHLELDSRPFLSRNEIFSLLLFGKRIDSLSISEGRELFMGDITNTFVNKFFLGKAEAKIAQVIGVDDLSVDANFAAAKGTQGFQMPSVEVGKYLGTDKVYGTYKICPPRFAGDKPQQTMAGECSLTDNLIVKGERTFRESIKLPREDKVSVEFRWKF